MTKHASCGPKLVANMPALQVHARVQGLFLARVGNLRDRRHLEVRWLADASKVTVAHSKDLPVGPHVSALCGLLHDLHVLVEVDPATSTWALVAEHALGHEIIRRFHANANVFDVCFLRQLDALPEGI